jgi:phage pi2 protein 07
MSETWLLDWLNTKPAEDTAPATWGDRARQVQRGAYETVSGLAGMGQFVTGGDDDDTFGQIKQWGEEGAQHATEQMTPTARRESEASFLPGGSGPSIWDSNVSLPGALTGKAAGMVPALLSMLVPGTLATRAFGAVAGTLAGGAINAATMGGQVFNQIEKEVDQAPSDVLAKENPFFARLVERGFSDEEARHALKSEIVGYRPYYMAAIAEATSRLNPAGQLAHGVEGSALTRMGKVGASAAVENTIQGATQDVLTQGGRTEATGKPFDPHELWSAALEGAVMGGATGAPFGLMAGKGAGKTPRKPQPAPKAKGVHVGDVDPAHEAALTVEPTEENPQDVPAPPPADGAEPARVDPSVPPEVVAATQALAEPVQAAPSESAPAPAPAPPAASAVAPAQAAPEAPTKKITPAVVGEFGKGAIGGMYDMLWSKVEAGDVTENGKPAALLQAAKTVREQGGTLTRDNFPEFAKDYARGRGNKTGPEFQQAMQELVQKWSPAQAAPAEPVKPTPAFTTDSPEATYTKAIDLIRTTGKGSLSFIQRKLKLKYKDAEALVGRLEADGLLGPPDKNGRRKVLAAPAEAPPAEAPSAKPAPEPESLPEQVTPAPSADEPVPEWLAFIRRTNEKNAAGKQRIEDLARSGLTDKEIAAETGYDARVVRRIRKQMKALPEQVTRPEPVAEPVQDRVAPAPEPVQDRLDWHAAERMVAELARQGKGAEEIAKETGLDVVGMARWHEAPERAAPTIHRVNEAEVQAKLEAEAAERLKAKEVDANKARDQARVSSKEAARIVKGEALAHTLPTAEDVQTAEGRRKAKSLAKRLVAAAERDGVAAPKWATELLATKLSGKKADVEAARQRMVDVVAQERTRVDQKAGEDESLRRVTEKEVEAKARAEKHDRDTQLAHRLITENPISGIAQKGSLKSLLAHVETILSAAKELDIHIPTDGKGSDPVLFLAEARALRDQLKVAIDPKRAVDNEFMAPLRDRVHSFLTEEFALRSGETDLIKTRRQVEAEKQSAHYDENETARGEHKEDTDHVEAQDETVSHADLTRDEEHAPTHEAEADTATAITPQQKGRERANVTVPEDAVSAGKDKAGTFQVASAKGRRKLDMPVKLQEKVTLASKKAAPKDDVDAFVKSDEGKKAWDDAISAMRDSKEKEDNPQGYKDRKIEEWSKELTPEQRDWLKENAGFVHYPDASGYSHEFAIREWQNKLDAHARELEVDRKVNEAKAQVRAEPEEIRARRTGASPETIERNGHTAAIIRSTTVKDILKEHPVDKLWEPGEGSKAIWRFFADRVSKLAGDVQVHIVSRADASRLANPGTQGFYNFAKDHIVLGHEWLDNPDRSPILALHEALHAAYNHALEDPKFKAHRDALDNLRQTVRSELERTRLINEPTLKYATSDVHEFVSEAFANPHFQEILQNIELPKGYAPARGAKRLFTRAWDALVANVKQVLGLDAVPRSVLEKTIEVTRDLDYAMGGKRDLARKDVTQEGKLRNKIDFGMDKKWADIKETLRGSTSDRTKSLADQIKHYGLKVATLHQMAEQGAGQFVKDGVDHYKRAVENVQRMQPLATKIQERSETLAQELKDLEKVHQDKIQDLPQLTQDVNNANVTLVGKNDHLGKDNMDHWQAKALLPALKARFDALPKDVQEWYGRATKHFRDTQNDITRRLTENILDGLEPGKLTDAQRTEIVDKVLAGNLDEDAKKLIDNSTIFDALRKAKELRAIKGDYFPQMRHGDYVVQTRDTLGELKGGREVEPGVVAFDSRDAARKFAEGSPYTVTGVDIVRTDKATGESSRTPRRRRAGTTSRKPTTSRCSSRACTSSTRALRRNASSGRKGPPTTRCPRRCSDAPTSSPRPTWPARTWPRSSRQSTSATGSTRPTRTC